MRFYNSIGILCAGAALCGMFGVSQSFAQHTKSGSSVPGKTVLLISADSTGVILPAPSGFVVDGVAASKVGVAAAYHPQGRTWTTADAVMYVNFSPRTAPGTAGVDAIIARDTQAVQDAANGTKATASGGGKTKTGIAYKTVDFKTANGAQERIAYLDTPDNVAQLVLSAQTRSAFQARTSSFTTWVRSASYVSTAKAQ